MNLNARPYVIWIYLTLTVCPLPSPEPEPEPIPEPDPNPKDMFDDTSSATIQLLVIQYWPILEFTPSFAKLQQLI